MDTSNDGKTTKGEDDDENDYSLVLEHFDEIEDMQDIEDILDIEDNNEGVAFNVNGEGEH